MDMYECTVEVEEFSVKFRVLRMALVLAVVLMLSVSAVADQTISTTLVMRVSHMTQNAVVEVGEDLSIEVNIDGVEPASYQWYFEDTLIEGANQKVYNILDAQTEDTGVYRVDAYDADGNLLVSMDISARVVDDSVPKSGDTSLPVQAAAAVMVLAAVGLVLALRRKATA